jgi:hypothetical protein
MFRYLAVSAKIAGRNVRAFCSAKQAIPNSEMGKGLLAGDCGSGARTFVGIWQLGIW